MRHEIHDDQSFEQRLYSQMCLVFPETTVRSFSAALGKSAGYWSSVCAQGLRVSNAALLHLMDYLECKKIRLDASSVRRQGIEKIQRQITAEILARLDLSADAFVSRGDAGFGSDKLLPTAINQPLPFVIFTNGYYSR
jgi:hypothetical protein